MSYTNISKPTGATYTDIVKPTLLGGGSTIKVGMITGLLIPLTYATEHTFPGLSSYTNVAKPTGDSYTNIAKPT